MNTRQRVLRTHAASGGAGSLQREAALGRGCPCRCACPEWSDSLVSKTGGGTKATRRAQRSGFGPPKRRVRSRRGSGRGRHPYASPTRPTPSQAPAPRLRRGHQAANQGPRARAFPWTWQTSLRGSFTRRNIRATFGGPPRPEVFPAAMCPTVQEATGCCHTAGHSALFWSAPGGDGAVPGSAGGEQRGTSSSPRPAPPPTPISAPPRREGPATVAIAFARLSFQLRRRRSRPPDPQAPPAPLGRGLNGAGGRTGGATGTGTPVQSPPARPSPPAAGGHRARRHHTASRAPTLQKSPGRKGTFASLPLPRRAPP